MSNSPENPLMILLQQRLDALEARLDALEESLPDGGPQTNRRPLETSQPDEPPFEREAAFVLWWYRTIIQRDATLEDAYAGLKKDGVKATPCTCSASYCRGWQIVSDYTSATPRIPLTPPWEVFSR